MRKDLPAIVLIVKTLPDVWFRMIVESLPVVDAPPVVAETAPAPWTVTECVKLALIPVVHVVLPHEGIAIMSPSTALASSFVKAVETLACEQLAAV
jgi:hypothetical protein